MVYRIFVIRMPRLQSVREGLTLVLLACLPLHALLVTVGTKLLLGANHAPWGLLAVWKEALLMLIVGMALWEFAREKIRQPTTKFRLDILDVGILLFVLLAVCVSLLTHGNLTLMLYGFRYDCVPLAAFMVLRHVSWSPWFWKTAENMLVGMAAVLSLYGAVTLLLPQAFFTWLGYSDMHSLYFPGKPIAAFQYIMNSETARVQSTMSGPNQFGAWLLVPYALLLWKLSTSAFVHPKRVPGWTIVFWLLTCVGLVFSLSRSAWIAAAFMTFVLAWSTIPKVLVRKYGAPAFGLLLAFVVLGSWMFPDILLRVGSSRGHFEKPAQALQMLWETPLGRGLGSVGPASSKVSDTCVHLREQDDPAWAKDIPDLCVFLGETQVQPAPSSKQCDCPFHPENWFLQIALETGVLGGVLYAMIIGYLVLGIWYKARWLAMSVIGLCVMSLFLHAWEDAAVAYTVWILAAATLKPTSSRAAA